MEVYVTEKPLVVLVVFAFPQKLMHYDRSTEVSVYTRMGHACLQMFPSLEGYKVAPHHCCNDDKVPLETS